VAGECNFVHHKSRARTQTSAVKGRRITDWAMARL